MPGESGRAVMGEGEGPFRPSRPGYLYYTRLGSKYLVVQRSIYMLHLVGQESQLEW